MFVAKRVKYLGAKIGNFDEITKSSVLTLANKNKKAPNSLEKREMKNGLLSSPFKIPKNAEKERKIKQKPWEVLYNPKEMPNFVA